MKRYYIATADGQPVDFESLHIASCEEEELLGFDNTYEDLKELIQKIITHFSVNLFLNYFGSIVF